MFDVSGWSTPVDATFSYGSALAPSAVFGWHDGAWRAVEIVGLAEVEESWDESLLNVSRADALIDAVRRCWDSLSSPRAVADRRAAGIGDERARMAVVVQRMVDPFAAGLLFTANLITGCRTKMIVDTAPGFGDVVVDGSVTADHYVLDGRQSLVA